MDGALALQRELPGDVVTMFVQPPSVDVLRVRMLARGDSVESVDRRLAADCANGDRARRACQRTVVNDDSVGDAVNQVHRILREARQARS